MPVRTSIPVGEDERSTTNSDTTAIDVSAQLREFRQAAYKCLCRTKDATFERLTTGIGLLSNAYIGLYPNWQLPNHATDGAT